MTTQSSGRVSPVWQAIVRGFTPDPVPLSPISNVVTFVAGVVNLPLYAIFALLLLLGPGGTAQSSSGDLTTTVQSAAFAVMAICWGGVMANIKAARWAITVVSVISLVLGIPALLLTPMSGPPYTLLWIALSLAAAAHPLFLRKRHTE